MLSLPKTTPPRKLPILVAFMSLLTHERFSMTITAVDGSDQTKCLDEEKRDNVLLPDLEVQAVTQSC